MWLLAGILITVGGLILITGQNIIPRNLSSVKTCMYIVSLLLFEGAAFFILKALHV